MLKAMEIGRCKKVEVLFASGLVSKETVEERQSQSSIKQPLFWVDEMPFPSLEGLEISKMEKLEIIWNIKDSHQRNMYSFPNLLHIDVSLCESLKSLFPAASVAASLEKLESLIITGCGVLEEIVEREDGTDPTTRLLFPSLICLGLYGLPKLKWFFHGVRTLESSSSKELHEQGGTLFVVEEVAFPSLKLLDLYGLPKIKHIWSKDSQSIPSFQNLQVIIAGKCVSLKSLFPASIVRCLEQLEKIKIYDCGVEEIVAAEGGEVVEMTLAFPQVTSLYLENLGRLKGMHDSKWSMLKQMRILECEKVKLSFPSLVTLEIRRMYKLEIMSRNVTIRKLWRSCYARCLHANESYRLRRALMRKLFIGRSIKAHHQSAQRIPPHSGILTKTTPRPQLLEQTLHKEILQMSIDEETLHKEILQMSINEETLHWEEY
ncbi:uncharacterized protein LOC121262220 [Juglans microcarpa x Juglans regia]|uniref:uncharacterized protein LOC121262220 n=1 Tax=Juglans microcarpa x Juglans regia TaxID=2249226 RepID=UPI001B7F4F86|nr:uncharacterized protein LOC121262220 [Juglans microcarpa x Juglans regia]